MRKITNIKMIVPLLLTLCLAGCVPIVTITSPQNGAQFEVGEEITFTGNATDLITGDLPDEALVWTSDKDGEIGTGRTLTKSDLSEGVHIITLSATDQDVIGAYYITITVVPGGTTGGETYEFVTKWGSMGSDDGQFKYPAGVAVDGNGNVYVVDGQNNRIQKFDGNGTFITKWGSKGSGDGQFGDLTREGIAVDSKGNVYVVDYDNKRIQKFDGNGTFIIKWGSAGNDNGQFACPVGIAIDDSGNVYVSDACSVPRIEKYDENGTFIKRWGSYGDGNDQFISPAGIAVNGEGNVYVADTWNNRVQIFDGNGTFIKKWGSQGSADGQFQDPWGAAIDGSGNVYVAETGNSRIQKFDGNGKFKAKWGTQGSGDGQFDSPYFVAVDGSGNVYVSDTGENQRIQKFKLSAGGITTTTTTTTTQPNTCGDATTISEENNNINIDVPTTWKKGLYVVDGSVQVDATLTIEAGTIIKFKSGAGIAARQPIIANGTKDKPIIFTSYKDDSFCGDTNGDGSSSSPAAGDWADVSMQGNGSIFNYCEFYYGGGDQSLLTATLTLNGVAGTVTNCTFAHNLGSFDYNSTWRGVLNLNDAAKGTKISANVFYDNDLPLSVNFKFSVDNSNVFHKPGEESIKNTFNGIYEAQGDTEVVMPVTWQATEVPFVTDGMWLSSTLTLGDGVVIKIRDNGGITFMANGVLSNYNGKGVYFTSYKDDAHLGDTNGDGTASAPADGDWDGIRHDKESCFKAYYEEWSNILYAKNTGCVE